MSDEPKFADVPVVNNNDKSLPVALRECEITEADVEHLLAIARDKDSPTGRFNSSHYRQVARVKAYLKDCEAELDAAAGVDGDE